MYRAASRLPRKVFLTASIAGAVVVHDQPREKLSIYSSPTPEVVLVETPSALEGHIGVARRQLCQTYSDGRDYVQGWVSKWIGIEHAVENRVKSIISPQESLTPGLLYVGIATLTGSIIARNRTLVTRFILPPVFFAVSAKHFLPKTTHNLSNYLGSIEDAHFPNFSEKHEIAKAHTAMTWERIREATKDTRAGFNHGAVTVIEKVQEATGLKLRDTLGWAGETERDVKAAVIEAENTVERAVADAATAVEQKVDGIKQDIVTRVEQVKETVGHGVEKAEEVMDVVQEKVEQVDEVAQDKKVDQVDEQKKQEGSERLI